MLSKLFTRLNQTQSMTSLATKAFRASPQMNKKPSIGDAVTILQSKVSNINQVVRLLPNTYLTKYAIQTVLSGAALPFLRARSLIVHMTLTRRILTAYLIIIERLEGVRYCDLHR